MIPKSSFAFIFLFLSHFIVTEALSLQPFNSNNDRVRSTVVQNDVNQHDLSHKLSRRDACISVLTKSFLSIPLYSSLINTNPAFAAQESTSDNLSSTTVYQLKSGLKYVELRPGQGETPKYGQLCSIQYTGFIKLPTESKPQKFDSATFLLKHGNGRIIPGLDEGLHTLKVGGKRRLIIPPKLGYIESGLGPIPELPWNRWTLNSLLRQMVQQRGGNVVFEVELLGVIDDEADIGYYSDLSPSIEEIEMLRARFEKQAL